MSVITRIAEFFRGSEDDEGDKRFRDAAETYRALFEEAQPLITRSLEADEFSPLWLDTTELNKRQEAIRELTASINSLRDSLDALDSASSTYENKFRIYCAAGEMHRNTLIAYARASACTSLAVARQQFNLMQKKAIASHESPDAEAAVQMEIDALNRLSNASELSQQEAASLELELDCSLEIAKLVFGSRRPLA
jgi:hypothetical protein